MKSKDFFKDIPTTYNLLTNTSDCKQLDGERGPVWKLIRELSENRKSFPAFLIVLWIQIKCISAELKVARKNSQEKNHYALKGLRTLPTFYLHTLLFSWCALQKKKVPLSQIVWGCFCPLESWLRSEANFHFKGRESYTSRSIHRVGPRQTSTIILPCRMLTPLKFPLNRNLSSQIYNTGFVD